MLSNCDALITGPASGDVWGACIKYSSGSHKLRCSEMSKVRSLFFLKIKGPCPAVSTQRVEFIQYINTAELKGIFP